jgi:hypothetical protein
MIMFGLAVAALIWLEARKWAGTRTIVAIVGCVLVLLGAREFGARLIRKLDWKRFGA